MVRKKYLPVSSCHRIVVLYFCGRFLKIPLQPLNSLKIILVLCLDQFIYIEFSTAAYFLESSLENFKVAHELVLKFRLPVNLTHWHHMPMIGVNELTVDRSRAQVLDVNNLKTKSFVNPLEQLVLRNEVGRVHQPNHSLTEH